MALFPHLEVEKRLQVNDKTRLSGTKSFVSTGSAAIDAVTVKPGADESAISVFNASSSNWFLDWEFIDFEGDFDSTNNKIDFKESGSELTATISAGTYTLSTLATQVQTQLNSAGSNTYTVTVDKDERMTIAADGNFSLLPNEGSNRDSSALPILGFSNKPGFTDEKYANSTSLKGEVIRWLPRAITLEIDNSTTPVSDTKYIQVFSESGDSLFSSDFDLVTKKQDILSWVKAGRNSFLNFHRQAQEEIIDWFRGEGSVNIDGDPLEVKNLVHPTDLNQWSTYLTLRLIFDDLSNDVDDIFDREARGFESREMRLRDRIMRIDIDNDGKSDIGENIQVRSAKLIRV